MKVLLTQTIERTGIVGEVIEVSDGFARNYLLPKGLGVQPTEGNIKRLETARKEYEAKLQLIRAEKEKLVQTLQGVEVTLVRNANDEGHLFGSVSKRDIAEELVYNHQLSAAEMQLIWSSLSDKYGLHQTDPDPDPSSAQAAPPPGDQIFVAHIIR